MVLNAAPTREIHINPNLIPSWEARELAACLLRDIRDHLNVQADQPDARDRTEQKGEE